MKYGPLGRSGLIVSRICLGGNSWGAKGRRGWGKFDEADGDTAGGEAVDHGLIGKFQCNGAALPLCKLEHDGCS